jgi:hypothetical protein
MSELLWINNFKCFFLYWTYFSPLCASPHGRVSSEELCNTVFSTQHNTLRAFQLFLTARTFSLKSKKKKTGNVLFFTNSQCIRREQNMLHSMAYGFIDSSEYNVLWRINKTQYIVWTNFEFEHNSLEVASYVINLLRYFSLTTSSLHTN